MGELFESCDSKLLVKELYERGQRIKELEDLLRWRDVKKEKPEKSGWYSVTFKGLPIPEYYHIEEGWCGPLRFWRPIGEMPGGKTYEPD